ncbi:glycosyltransferase [Craterilacuibacter sp. RT1T]|nr:glycosyltransferase [Craterilacuibacter sp. RT1T]
MSHRLLYLTREKCPSFRPDLAQLFGVELPKLGWLCDIAAVEDVGAEGDWPAGETFLQHATGPGGRLIASFRAALSLFTLPSRKQYCAIQVRDRAIGALIGLLAARWHGLPFFYWMSFPLAEEMQDVGKGRIHAEVSIWRRLFWRIRGRVSAWILYRWVLPRADHVFVQSDAMKSMLADKGVLSGRMTPVPMGVSLPAALDQLTPPADKRLYGRRLLIYLGALERRRHPELMLEAMVQVVQAEPDAYLVLVGDAELPGDRQWLDREIVRLRLTEHVHITGWLPAHEARCYLKEARLGLSPIPRSRVFDVSSPTKVAEYLAYGVPVIANDLPDQKILLNACAGGLCVPLTADDFANAILVLLRDPVRARQMGEQGRSRIAFLRSYPVLAAMLADCYDQLLASPALPASDTKA